MDENTNAMDPELWPVPDSEELFANTQLASVLAAIHEPLFELDLAHEQELQQQHQQQQQQQQQAAPQGPLLPPRPPPASTSHPLQHTGVIQDQKQENGTNSSSSASLSSTAGQHLGRVPLDRRRANARTRLIARAREPAWLHEKKTKEEELRVLYEYGGHPERAHAVAEDAMRQRGEFERAHASLADELVRAQIEERALKNCLQAIQVCFR